VLSSERIDDGKADLQLHSSALMKSTKTQSKLNRGRKRRWPGRSAEAETICRRCLPASRGMRSRFITWAVLAFGAGRIEPALDLLLRATEAAPRPSRFPGLFTGRSWNARAPLLRCAPLLQRAVALKPDDARYRYDLGRLSVRWGTSIIRSRT